MPITKWVKQFAGWLAGTVAGGVLGFALSYGAGEWIDNNARGYFEASFFPVMAGTGSPEYVSEMSSQYGRNFMSDDGAGLGIVVTAPLLGMFLWCRLGGIMTILRAYLLVFGTGALFGVGGGLVGWALAVANPGYYRGVFRSGSEPWFDPVQVGVGLGISEGLTAGTIVGAVVALALAYYRARVDSARIGAAGGTTGHTSPGV